MKNHRIKPLTFVLLAVLLASACVPAVTSSSATEAVVPIVSVPTATLAVTQPAIQLEATLAPTEVVLPVTTSRGANLEASDPTTVALASGGLQLVEFFRFT